MVRMESKQRKQKISQETWPQRGAVNTLGYEEGHSLQPTQIKEEVRAKQHNNLMEQVVQRDNMKRALRRVERNKGVPGVDGVTVENFRPYLKIHWERIKGELLTGTYKPQIVRRVEIPKPGGGVRLLGIPTVMDRLIQQAVLQILSPLIDPEFSQNSFGFRPGCSTHQAVRQAQSYIKDGYWYVVDIDVEKFFDKVNHDILMSKLKQKIADRQVIRLIRSYLQAGVMINGCCITSE